jgi:hypothetical protein
MGLIMTTPTSTVLQDHSGAKHRLVAALRWWWASGTVRLLQRADGRLALTLRSAGCVWSWCASKRVGIIMVQRRRCV